MYFGMQMLLSRLLLLQSVSKTNSMVSNEQDQIEVHGIVQMGLVLRDLHPGAL